MKTALLLLLWLLALIPFAIFVGKFIRFGLTGSTRDAYADDTIPSAEIMRRIRRAKERGRWN